MHININSVNTYNIIIQPKVEDTLLYSTREGNQFYCKTNKLNTAWMTNPDSDGAVLQLTSTEILRLLASDNNNDNGGEGGDVDVDVDVDNNGSDTSNDNEPLTGETMEVLSKRMKADVRCIDIQEFITIAQRKRKNKHNIPICDARSPGEFAIGHIPGANNLPLFTNEERAIVGTLFNNTGRSEAMVMGMSIVRPKLDALVSEAAAIVANARGNNGSNNIDDDDDDGDDDKDALLLHCWRGGMRSCALAFLVQTRIPGLTVYVLKDGYKAFRNWQYSLYCYLPANASYSDSYSGSTSNSSGLRRHRMGNMSQKQRIKQEKRNASASGIGIAQREASIAKIRARNQSPTRTDVTIAAAATAAENDAAQGKAEWVKRFNQGPRIAIIGGPTGSGKTKVLHALRDILGEQIIDLEGLANHSGSVYGFVGHEHAEQPTPRQYTNNVAMEWNNLDPERWVFIEDEGPNVGSVNLPVGLYRKMRTASTVLKLDIPKDIRVEVLREDYALPEKKTKEGSSCNINTDQKLSEWLSNMIEATRKLEKRIGQVRMNKMIDMLRDGCYAEFARAALDYYDDLYDQHIANEHGSANMRGNGERAGGISTVTVENMEQFDAEAVARQVLMSLNKKH